MIVITDTDIFAKAIEELNEIIKTERLFGRGNRVSFVKDCEEIDLPRSLCESMPSAFVRAKNNLLDKLESSIYIK